MARRGRPKGSKNKKTVEKEYQESLRIPDNATIWCEIWHNGVFHGWSTNDKRPGIQTLLHAANGNLSKAKKMDRHKMYFPYLVSEKPKGKKNNPVHIMHFK